MKSILASLPFILALMACGGNPPNPASVAAVKANIHRWDGKVVTVNGWLGACQPYGCQIYGSKADMEAVEYANYADWSKADVIKASERALGVGNGATFDRVADKLRYSRVLLTAKINDECTSTATMNAICTDRVNDLDPISVKAFKDERLEN